MDTREPGAELARWFCTQYQLGRPVNEDRLLWVIQEQLKVEVLTCDELGEEGYYFSGPYPWIVVGAHASLRVLCHEAYHAVKDDHRSVGIVTAYRGDPRRDEEKQAHAFAACLCDPPDGGFHERYRELLARYPSLSYLPAMSGVERLSQPERDALLEAVEAALRQHSRNLKPRKKWGRN